MTKPTTVVAVFLSLGLILAAAARAQLPPPPTISPALQPNMPHHPLPRLERLRDGEPQLGCPVTLVEGLGAVTARHCGVGGREPRDLAVRFGSESRRVLGAVVPDERATEDGQLVRPQHDWAILELEAPPTDAHVFAYVGRAGLIAADRVSPLLKLGPGRQPEGPPDRGACWPVEVAPGGVVFAFRCTDGTRPGRSGSPLLVRTGDGWGFVGIHVADASTPQGTIGIAIVPPPR